MRRELPLVILSLSIALLLAYYVRSEGNASQVGISVPVEIGAPPPGRMVVRPLRPQVELVLRGPAFLVSQLLLSPPTVRIDFPAEVRERHTVQLATNRLELPAGVEIVSMRPASLTFDFEALLEKTVRVEVPRIGVVSDEMQLDQLEARPTEITVRGPASQVERLTRLVTEPIDLREIRGNDERTVSVRPAGELVTLRESSVKVRIVASARQGEFTVRGVPVTIEGSELFEAQPAEIAVTVRGLLGRVRSLRADQIRAVVTLTSERDAQRALPVTVTVPSEGTVVRVEPSSVRLRRLPKR